MTQKVTSHHSGPISVSGKCGTFYKYGTTEGFSQSILLFYCHLSFHQCCVHIIIRSREDTTPQCQRTLL